MASDAPRPTPDLALRALREQDYQMSRPEFAKVVARTGEEMGENVGCTPRLIAAWEDGTVACPRPAVPSHPHSAYRHVHE